MLRLGQGVGALLLDGVLRREHEERLVGGVWCMKPPAVTWCSCMASRRADCVLGGVRVEQGAGLELEPALLIGTDDVARHQVRGEL